MSEPYGQGRPQTQYYTELYLSILNFYGAPVTAESIEGWSTFLKLTSLIACEAVGDIYSSVIWTS